jgi:hypothetical protein
LGRRRCDEKRKNKELRHCYVTHEGVSLIFGPFVVAFFFNQACTKRSPADGRISWSCSKQRSKKFWASVEMSEGIGGFAEEEPIYTIRCWLANEMFKNDSRHNTLKMACIWLSWAHGCSPVSISTIRHPTLHISAFFVYATCLTTSGAIQ